MGFVRWNSSSATVVKLHLNFPFGLLSAAAAYNSGRDFFGSDISLASGVGFHISCSARHSSVPLDRLGTGICLHFDLLWFYLIVFTINFPNLTPIRFMFPLPICPAFLVLCSCHYLSLPFIPDTFATAWSYNSPCSPVLKKYVVIIVNIITLCSKLFVLMGQWRISTLWRKIKRL